MRVTIAIPTYNRVGTLRRTLDSALGQTHADLTVLISDNASDDGTEELCRGYAERDERVRYHRHASNIGPTPNFNWLFEHAADEYVLMLADDDWIDPEYVEVCLRELRARPDHVLVAGRARYYRDGAQIAEGADVQVAEDDGGARVRSYYRQVDDNGTFYGVMRRAALRGAAPMNNELGNDWFHLAAIAFQGKLATLGAPVIHRDASGTSSTLAGIVETFGGNARLRARVPHLFMAATAFAEIAWRAPVYAPLGRVGRLVLALRAAPLVIDWKSLAWHVVAPSVARLGRRPRGRGALRAFDRVTRRLGAGKSRLG